ncbi:hypothetical protein ACFW6Z_22510, partial [Streptomyces albidoflavus]
MAGAGSSPRRRYRRVASTVAVAVASPARTPVTRYAQPASGTPASRAQRLSCPVPPVLVALQAAGSRSRRAAARRPSRAAAAAW